jgi:hypothetical protein
MTKAGSLNGNETESMSRRRLVRIAVAMLTVAGFGAASSSGALARHSDGWEDDFGLSGRDDSDWDDIFASGGWDDSGHDIRDDDGFLGEDRGGSGWDD